MQCLNNYPGGELHVLTEVQLLLPYDSMTLCRSFHFEMKEEE